jgi:uncharacterized cupredoxin-like copper-binding protein
VDISLKNGGQAPHEFACNTPGHYGDGMRGQLTVQ